MMSASTLSRLLAAGALVAATGLASAGREQQDQNQPTFRTEANYVRVDAYPTAGGAPVMDLQRDDFEVIEDGAAQRVDAFEHVLIRGYTPQQDRAEPNTVAESRAMVENRRSRVFVL